MSRVIQDLRHALRACLRAPLVSTLAIVAFTLGIGVTTAVFSIFYNVLLKPLPYLLTGTLQTMLNDVTPRDPVVFAATVAAVLTAALLASWLPARSAGNTDPMIVLRDS